METVEHVYVAGYNKWRRFCGLKTATSFETMVDITDVAVRRKFRTLYRYVQRSVVVNPLDSKGSYSATSNKSE